MLVEEARRSKEKHIPIDLDNIRAYIEKTVLLLGQTGSSRREICWKKVQRSPCGFIQIKKNRPLKYLLKKGKKKQNPLRNTPKEAPSRSSGGQHSKIFLNRFAKICEIESKNIRRKLPPIYWNKQWINTKETHKENLLQYVFPPIIPIEDLRSADPLVKSLFSAIIAPNLPLAQRLKHSLEA